MNKRPMGEIILTGRPMKEMLRLVCECGEWIETNDNYLFDDVRKLWAEWHEDGAFVAGKYHKPQNKDSDGQRQR